MVMVTGSYARSEKMSVSQELRDYSSKLIQPKCLEQMFQKLKKEIVTKFDEKFIEQNKKNDGLENEFDFKKISSISS